MCFVLQNRAFERRKREDRNGTVRAKITQSAKRSVGLILSIIVTCHRQSLGTIRFLTARCRREWLLSRSTAAVTRIAWETLA